ncbi:MAG: site-specific integrase [Oligoflexia bacterium]|nr:site-specific integrase [Oligoflexia bacterium]
MPKKSSAEHLPAVAARSRASGGFEATHELWVRLSAFLSLRSPNTQDTYLGILREWCEFIGVEFGSSEGAARLVAATDLHAVAYRNWLHKRPGERPRMRRTESESRAVDVRRARLAKSEGLEDTLSNATIAKKFAALRRIYRMFIAAGLGCSSNQFDSDRVPAPPKESGRKRPTEMIDFSLVRRVISVPDATSPKGLRDKAILSVLFGGALRRSEASRLRIADVRKTARGTIFLYLRSTKAKKDAEQALPDWAAAVVSKLVAQRRREKAADADFLFVSYTGRGGRSATNLPVSVSGIYKLFKHYCEKAGAGAFVSPHSARATAITKLLDQGIPHREVQGFSRHSSIQMVELYDKRRMSVDQGPGKALDFESE